MNRPRIAPLFAIACLCLATASASAQPRPTVDKLVATFDDVVFGAEIDDTMRAKVVAKWSDVLRISVKGQAEGIHIDYLKAHLKTIRALTGLKLGPVEAEENPENISIVFVPEAQMSKIKIDTVDPKLIQILAGPRSCYFLSFRDPPDRFIRSIIVVNNERTSRAINHCLLEEVIQSLGLPNDSNLIRPSIFSDLDKLIKVTRSDEILIRTLYDPRLKAGTDRQSALVIAREIITELDAELPLN